MRKHPMQDESSMARHPRQNALPNPEPRNGRYRCHKLEGMLALQVVVDLDASREQEIWSQLR